jgi:ATP-dependent DNA helicase RecG
MAIQHLVMAPTTILAQQHYNSFKAMLEQLGIRVILKTSNEKTSKSNKNTADTLELLKLTETPTVIIGTHALLYDKQLPKNVALVVVDEQHRFGVKQRATLSDMKTAENVAPHYLSMTATPIPRTLTTVLYGDMEVSFIKTMPSNRLTIKSFYVPDKKRADCFSWVKKHITESNFENQAFVIFPLIQESEKVEAKAAITEYEKLSKSVFKDLKVGLLHGQLKQQEKDDILMKFRNKEFNVLVATSVVEVGIDIPDATVMIIENAERFGLAQLHQFRGRVGRGDKQSYCYVLSGGEKASSPDSEDANNLESTESAKEQKEKAVERLKYFCTHPSGFDVAQFDLQNRGPGEVYGDIQSGIPNLKIANILDLELLTKARRSAQMLMNNIMRLAVDNILEHLFA